MRDHTKRRIRWLGVLLFILYILLLVYFLLFSEEYGRTVTEERLYRYNLVPFVEIRRFGSTETSWACLLYLPIFLET